MNWIGNGLAGVGLLVLAQAALAQIAPNPPVIDTPSILVPVAPELAGLDSMATPDVVELLAGPIIRSVDTAGLSTGRLWAETITANELREHAYILASDSLQGRETGTLGQQLAARYIAGQVDALGAESVIGGDSYQQPIAFARSGWDSTLLQIEGQAFRFPRDFYGLPGEITDLDTSLSDVVYLGYGIAQATGYSDYREAQNLSGKIAIVLAGEPTTKDSLSLITNSTTPSVWAEGDSLKRIAAQEAGLRALLIVEPAYQKLMLANTSRILEKGLRTVDPDSEEGIAVPSSAVDVLHVSPAILEALAGKQRKRIIRARKRALRKGYSEPVILDNSLDLVLQVANRRLEGSNVLAYIPGRDDSVADELVVVSAHYDHLGMRGETVFNGADDNASGSSTVLEIAEALAAAHRVGQGPRRSVLCLWVSGEEKGLLGSQYYAEHPVLPLETTIADINIDMIGRYDEAHADSSAYIYVIGAGRISPDLDSAVQRINSAYAKLDLDYTFDAADDPNRFYYRSDHYNFAKSGIPSVFFFSGVHEDYHRPSDTPDKLDYQKMERVGRNAFLLAWNLANREGDLNRGEGL